MVAYTDLPEAFLEQGPKVVLNAVRDAVMEDMGMSSLASLEIDFWLDDYPGRRYRYSDRDGTIDMRLYLVDERLYLIAGAAVDEATVNRFIDSFELL